MDISGKKIDEVCPVCNTSDHWSFQYHSEFNQFHLPIYRCEQCGLQTQFPKPNTNEMYDENYYSGKSDYSYIDERKLEKYHNYVWDARIRNIQKFVPGGNFLDVGSSFGGFLSRARKFGFQPYGVEVSEYSSNHSRSNGIETFTGNYLDNPFPTHFFDVITLIEVIEHMENPREVFRKFSDQMKSGGMLLLQTANFEGKQALEEGKKYHYYLPGHIYYYSLSNLKKILKEFGFSRTKDYLGVDFPLSAKLLKSRGNSQTLWDYRRWLTIISYHMKSKILPGSTSSMVVYAFKD